MSRECYYATIPVFLQGCSVLRELCDRAQRHAEKNAFPVERLLEARLAPDMLSFIGQVQYAYFTALEAVELLAGTPQPTMSYEEKTLADLRASLDTLEGHLRSVKPENMQDAVQKEVTTYLRPDKKIAADVYAFHASLPNFFFHITTAYDILRAGGVPLGKDVYIGPLPPDATGRAR